MPSLVTFDGVACGGCSVVSEILADLPLVERVKRYREVAAETEVWAMRARSADVREGYRKLAETWLQLALELERAGDCAPKDGSTLL